MIQDIINGSFELLAGAAVALHCAQLLRDREVKGVSLPAVLFFTVWGCWNMYYYPFLGQPWSFAGGVIVTLANTAYLALLVRFGNGTSLRKLRRTLLGLVCRVRGHHYPAPVFRSNCLYFCTRCGKEMLGRTFADIEPISDEDLEEIHREMAMEGRP